MSKGKIEKQYPEEFKVISRAMSKVWNDYMGTNSDYKYQDMGLSFTRFIWDSFYKTGLRIGDGRGMSGDVTIPGINDNHLETAFKAIWDQYLKEHDIKRKHNSLIIQTTMERAE